jgi:putative oxidoreductase
MKATMINIFNPGNYSNTVSIASLLLRLSAGVFMLTHGVGKLFMLVGDNPIQFADPIGLGETTSLVLAVFAEVFCSVFLIFGIATRVSVIPLIITMLVAALLVHAPDVFGKKELPLLYSAVYIALALTGAGKYSVDHWIFKKLRLTS